MKKAFFFVGGLCGIVLFIPLINMTMSPPVSVEHLGGITNPSFKEAAIILQTKCADCHSSQSRLPFYAKIPFAQKLIARDIADGLARFNFDGKLAENGALFSDLDLARLEGVTYNSTMSPARYRILHWDRGFDKNAKNTVRKWVYDERARRRLALGITGPFAGEPFAPLKPPTDLSEDKVQLGKLLFHDTRLSGDDKISCATCHSLAKGGTDRAVSSTGIRAQVGPINAPTVFNAVYNHRQFWDGRAANLEEQAGGPVTNPMEMGADWNDVLAKLRKDNELVTKFNAAYSDGLTQKNILNAIATFEQSLVTPNSKFDRFLAGDNNAINETERRGYELFKVHCASCHAGPAMGGLSFEKLGVKKDYFATRGRKPLDADLGLYNVTKNIEDKHKFKVPTLRNIAQSYPYFHDGSAATLEEAIGIMATHQLAEKFSQAQINELASFLRTLTGEYEGKLLQ